MMGHWNMSLQERLTHFIAQWYWSFVAYTHHHARTTTSGMCRVQKSAD